MPSHDLMVVRKREIRDNDNVDDRERFHKGQVDEDFVSDAHHSGHVGDDVGGSGHEDDDGGDKYLNLLYYVHG